MKSRASSLLACLALLLVSGCSSQTYSIRELGHPAFESIVGRETAFERADPKQRQGLDAFTGDVQDEGDHRLTVRFSPVGSEDKIGLEIRARAKGKLPLQRLAAAVFAVSRQESSTFAVTGVLPDSSAPIAFSGEYEQDEDGWINLILIFERKAIPEDAEWLAISTLSQFADDWIRINFLGTMIPAVTRPLTKEDVEQIIKARQAKDGEPSTTEDAPQSVPLVEPLEGDLSPAQAPQR